MRIGHQGTCGSNSEKATHILVEKCAFPAVSYVPLITSGKIASELINRNIDYGVVVIRNTLGGIVSETLEVLRKSSFEIIKKIQLSIHHCLYKYQNIQNEDLQYVASRIQVLKQTERTRTVSYPQLIPVAIEDTAIRAEWLASGRLSRNIAVICSREAGELYDLELIQENLEDDPQNNFTEFALIRLAEKELQ